MQLTSQPAKKLFTANKGLISINILFLVSTITFGIFYSSLNLLLVQKFLFSPVTALGLVGLFFAFHYSLGIIGGKIGDKYIDCKVLFICGKIFQLLSAVVLVLALDNHRLLYLGLGLFLVDSMVSMVSLNMLVTDYFKKSNLQGRLFAFLSTHIWTNLGFITAFFISGAIYHYYSVEKLLYVIVAFSIITLFFSLFIIPSREMTGSSLMTKYPFSKTLLGMLFVSLLISSLLMNFHFARELIFLVAITVLIIVIIRSGKMITREEIRGLLSFCLFMTCSLGFWSIYMLGPTFIPLFIVHDVDTYFLGMSIPPQWIQITGPLTVVLGGSILKKFMSFLMQKKNIELSRKANFTFGLLCASLALLVMIGGMSRTDHLPLSYGWVILYIFIMATGEILLAPASKALVGDLVPKKLQGLCLGITQMTLGISVIISGVISEIYLVHDDAVVVNNLKGYDSYVNVFESLIVISLIIIFGLYFFDRLLRKNDNLCRI